jgi:hypothetical protein
MKGRAKTQPTTNKLCIGHKAALGLRQIVGLMPPAPTTRFARAQSCRQRGKFSKRETLTSMLPVKRIKNIGAEKKNPESKLNKSIFK